MRRGKHADAWLDPALQNLTAKQINALGGPKIKWRCCVGGCNNFATVTDFSQYPFYWWRTKWVDLTAKVLYCGRHWPLHKSCESRGIKFEPLEGFKPGPGIDHLDKK